MLTFNSTLASKQKYKQIRALNLNIEYKYNNSKTKKNEANGGTVEIELAMG